MRLLVLALFGGFISTSCTSPSNNGQPNPTKTILVSFDGFRADYLTKTETPNFDKLIENGVTAEGLIPIFPSKTFPNYYALATGLYPENSGFVGNNMYDKEMDARFTMRNRDAVENPEWYGGEPIWNTAEKQGVRAGTMFWVGSEAPVQNMRPTHWKIYDGSFADSARIDTVVSWLTLNTEKEVDFATLYFSFVDSQGHRTGPDSEEVIETIERADDLIGYLIEKISNSEEKGEVNVIIVSDHGMAAVSPERVVLLDDLVPNPDVMDVIEYSPSVMFNITAETPAEEEKIYQMLKEKEAENPYRIWKKKDIPERFHLKNHDRVPDYLMLADVGYTITTKSYMESRTGYPSGGTHGFDNQAKEMHAIFVANGPDFKSGKRLGTFESVNIYELIAHLLDISPAETDGDLSVFKDVLK